MSQVITPTVGRKVWYRPSGHNRTQLGVWNDDQPCDATVTYVWHDRMVNLHVIGPAGAVHQFNSVQLLQAGDPVPAGIEHGGYAEWMPYQTGQARKDAAIDRVINMNTPLGASPAPVVAAQAQSTIDFLAGSKACDIAGDTCEACQ